MFLTAVSRKVCGGFFTAFLRLKPPFCLKIAIRFCSCPLAFRNFLSKIFRKPKMGCAPHHLASQGASPEGKPQKEADNFC